MAIFEPVSFFFFLFLHSPSTPHQQNGYEISGTFKHLLTQDIPE